VVWWWCDDDDDGDDDQLTSPDTQCQWNALLVTELLPKACNIAITK
jgi:hypothetical protein